MKLLFEIGTEELPPATVVPSVEFLASGFAEKAQAERLSYGKVETFATPRRLTIRVSDIAECSENVEETRTGPPVRISYDGDGNPTKAALGFAKGLGVDVASLQSIETGKGQYLAARVVHEGKPAPDILPSLLENLITDIPWPKTMHWGWTTEAWARPVHWIVAILDNQTLSLGFAGIKSGNKTRGHRFLNPDEIEILAPDAYEDVMERAHVVPSVAARREMIHRFAEQAVAPNRLVADAGLIDEVTQLVEYPICAVGQFDERYLKLPREVLISEMREHQRYFAVEDENGDLVNQFVITYNTIVRDPELVIRGNQRVLVARLSDGAFFLKRDQQRTLASRVDDLGRVVFLEKLGSIRDKVERVVDLSSFMAGFLFPDVADVAKRVALLSKADLTTDMVGEFPELQGVMGREYALRDGEPEAVATAIYEHYLPRSANDELPSTPAGIIVAIADRIDTIAACFSIGLRPSGTADPFGLRRAALGIIKTVLKKELVFSLNAVIRKAVDTVGDKRESPAEDVCDAIEGLFKRRLKSLLGDVARSDVIEAVLATGIDDLVAVVARVKALTTVRDDDEFEPLAIGFKRVANILENPPEGAVDTNRFEQEAEGLLWKAYLAAKTEVDAHLTARDFKAAVSTLIKLKEPVDRFFDDVLVMADDEKLKRNRLALLRDLRSLFWEIADISKIQVSQQ